MLLLFTAAFRFGDQPERWVASVLFAMSLISNGYVFFIQRSLEFVQVEPVMLIVEIFVTVFLIVIALKANRVYPLWIAGFQIIALLAHLARSTTDEISPIAYAILVVGPSYFQIIILAFGIWLHHRRTRRHGSYRPWRNSSRHSPVSAHRN